MPVQPYTLVRATQFTDPAQTFRMLKTVNLVHIGDVHFPEATNERLGDFKDRGFPSAVEDLARLSPLTCVARALTEVIEHSPDALIFTGDLTSFGEPTGYKHCLEYFDGMLNLKRWKPEKVHVVPGNHDVERSKVDPAGHDLTAKFESFKKLWEGVGLPILSVDGVRSTSLVPLKSGIYRTALYSMNSSLGCGERRYPEKVRVPLTELLNAYAASVPPDEAFELLGETLDTPAFNQAHVDEVCSSIASLDRKTIPLVIAHHNLLPQALPRIAMYSELINAGLVRSRLSHLQRPVVYCHGHIHDHPVEVISEPEFDGSRLICIAAPKFSEGFNSIAIQYSSTEEPLGCIVTSYRLITRDGQVRPNTFRVPFHAPTHANVRHLCSPLLNAVLANLSEADLRFSELLQKLSLKGQQKQTLEVALLEGEWLGVLALSEKQEDRVHWIIRKVIR